MLLHLEIKIRPHLPRATLGMRADLEVQVQIAMHRLPVMEDTNQVSRIKRTTMEGLTELEAVQI